MNSQDILELMRTVKGHISPHELISLYEYAGKVTHGHIVEIGSFQGLSTIALAKGSATDVRVYAIDPHDPYTDVSDTNAKFSQKYDYTDMGMFAANIVQHRVAHKVFPIALPSFAINWEETDVRIGLLFIDGDHDYYGVYGDFETFSIHLCTGGYLLFHDSAWDGPKKVMQELNKDIFELVEIVDSLSIYRKKIYSD